MAEFMNHGHGGRKTLREGQQEPVRLAWSGPFVSREVVGQRPMNLHGIGHWTMELIPLVDAPDMNELNAQERLKRGGMEFKDMVPLETRLSELSVASELDSQQVMPRSTELTHARLLKKYVRTPCGDLVEKEPAAKMTGKITTGKELKDAIHELSARRSRRPRAIEVLQRLKEGGLKVEINGSPDELRSNWWGSFTVKLNENTYHLRIPVGGGSTWEVVKLQNPPEYPSRWFPRGV